MLLIIALFLIFGLFSKNKTLVLFSKIVGFGFIMFTITAFSLALGCDNKLLNNQICGDTARIDIVINISLIVAISASSLYALIKLKEGISSSLKKEQ
jgi:hypothetical protein